MMHGEDCRCPDCWPFKSGTPAERAWIAGERVMPRFRAECVDRAELERLLERSVEAMTAA